MKCPILYAQAATKQQVFLSGIPQAAWQGTGTPTNQTLLDDAAAQMQMESECIKEECAWWDEGVNACAAAPKTTVVTTLSQKEYLK